MSNWSNIWKNRQVKEEKFSYEYLLALNGYDGKQSNLNPQNLGKAQNAYARKMNLQRGDDVFEIGCGSGGFLYAWHNFGHAVGGIDLSPELIKVAKTVMPNGVWDVAEAPHFMISRRWDHTVSFSMAEYITMDVLKETILKMIAKSKYSVSIFDIPDAEKKEESEQFRRETIPGYDEKYQGLSHTYYYKSEIAKYLEELGFDYEIYDQQIEDYENSRFRFNFTIRL